MEAYLHTCFLKLTLSEPYLLEVGSKAVHVLVVGQKGMGFTSIAVYIPDPQHGQQNRHVFLQRGSVEVIILCDTKENYTTDEATVIPHNSLNCFYCCFDPGRTPQAQTF